MINKSSTTFLILICIIFNNKPLPAQNYTLEPLDSILAHIQEINQTSLEKHIRNYHQTKTPNWYHFLPSIGYNAIAQGFSINFSLNSFVAIADRKRAQQYQVNEWTKTSQTEQTQNIIQAKNTYRQLQNQLHQAIISHQILQTDSISFDIKQHNYNDTKITTEQYLDDKRKYLTRQQDFIQIRQKIIDLVNQISLIQQKELRFRAPFLNL